MGGWLNGERVRVRDQPGFADSAYAGRVGTVVQVIREEFLVAFRVRFDNGTESYILDQNLETAWEDVFKRT